MGLLKDKTGRKWCLLPKMPGISYHIIWFNLNLWCHIRCQKQIILVQFEGWRHAQQNMVSLVIIAGKQNYPILKVNPVLNTLTNNTWTCIIIDGVKELYWSNQQNLHLVLPWGFMLDSTTQTKKESWISIFCFFHYLCISQVLQ